MGKRTDAQLDIIDEAINLMQTARAEVYQLTFEQALEIVKIQRIEELAASVDGVSKQLYDYL